MTPAAQLLAAVNEIIEGRNVNRSVHNLSFEGRDLTGEFVKRLLSHGYSARTVGEVDVAFGERVPAFAVRSGTAYFGWVFIEKFSDTKSRKLFGSIVKNTKGDWAIQISQKSRELVYVNPREKSAMELEPTFVME